MTTRDNSGGRTAGWRLALAGGMLLATLVLGACSTPVTAVAPPTPVPPAALATIPPARPIPSPGTANGPQVEIANFNFTPAELMVTVGGTVTWTNNDDAPHTVTSTDRTFSSPSVNTDGQFAFTFTTPGTYAYFCAIHPFMTGKVIVQ